MTADTMTRAAAPPKQPSMRRLIVAATIGNVFEWFDFVVYGFFAVTLAEVFFPAGDPTVSLLITFGVFALAYFVRPLGAIVVGGYTDRAGRKAGLLLSMALMMIGTTLMAVTPGYATIGLAAPIIIRRGGNITGLTTDTSSGHRRSNGGLSPRIDAVLAPFCMIADEVVLQYTLSARFPRALLS